MANVQPSSAKSARGKGFERMGCPSLGINVITALETCPLANGNITWFGGEDDMILSAQWRG